MEMIKFLNEKHEVILEGSYIPKDWSLAKSGEIIEHKFNTSNIKFYHKSYDYFGNEHITEVNVTKEFIIDIYDQIISLGASLKMMKYEDNPF